MWCFEIFGCTWGGLTVYIGGGLSLRFSHVVPRNQRVTQLVRPPTCYESVANVAQV
jgi:hypothetical protein